MNTITRAIGDEVVDIPLDSYEEFMHHARSTGTISISADNRIDAGGHTCNNGVVDKITLDNKFIYMPADDYIDASVYAIYKGEDKMKLLEIYEDKLIEKIHNEYEDKIEKVKATDPKYKEILEFYKKVKSQGVVVETACYDFSDSILKKIRTLRMEEDEKRSDLYSLIREIKAQLEICETYEQKMAVLRNYNVVDENNVLVK